VNELKAAVQESKDRFSESHSKDDGETKDELQKLRAKCDELSAEEDAWLSRQSEYEQKIGKVTTELLEAKAALSELEHKRKSADTNRSEIEVLRAKLTASEKSVVDKGKSIDRQINFIKDECKQELEDSKKEHQREISKRDHEQKTLSEQYEYKLQYLELSQQELHKERKRWQDKEREYEKSLVALTAELRHLKLEHQHAVDLHEAFRAHIDAKESARQMENSSWDIKKQTLTAEHQLALRQSETAKNSRIAQLEREVNKMKGELDDAHEEIERLTVALEAGAGHEST